VRNANKPRQQEVLAVAEDRAGEQVIKAAAMAEHYRRMKKWVSEGMPIYTPRHSEPLLFISMNKMTCEREDEHSFNSTGLCSTCGAHRAPAR